MKKLFIIFLTIAAISAHGKTLTTKDGTTYQDVEIYKKYTDSVLIIHSKGAAQIPLAQLTEDALKLIEDEPAEERRSRPEPVNPDRLNVAFLGLHLGCTLEEARKVMRNSQNQVRQIERSKGAGGTESIIFQGNHRFSQAYRTNLVFFDGKLLSVHVFFRGDNIEGLSKRLQRNFERKYNTKMQSTGFLEKGLMVSGMGVIIERGIGVSITGGDELRIVATHERLGRRWQRNMSRQR